MKKVVEKETKDNNQKEFNVTIEDKIRNLTFVIIIGFIVMFILIIGLYFKGSENTTSKSGNDTPTQESSGSEDSGTYEVDEMKKVSVEEAIDLFDKSGTHVIYIGRSDCSYCVKTAPVLTDVQKDLGYTTNYLAVETSTINKSWSEWQKELKPLAELMDIETTVNGEEDTFGNLLVNKGYTPTVIVIKDGKMVDGFFGYNDYDSIKEIVEKYL